MCTSKPSVPSVPEVEDPPEPAREQDPEVVRAREEELRKNRAASGRIGTFSTGSSGLTNLVPTAGMGKKILG